MKIYLLLLIILSQQTSIEYIIKFGYSNTLCANIDVNLQCFNMDPNLITVDISNISNTQVQSFSLGSNHICYENDQAELQCTGGDNQFDQTTIPRLFNKLPVYSFVSGTYHNCGMFDQKFLNQNSINQQYQLTCWGLNNFGQVDIPPAIKEYSNLVNQIFSGPYTSCVKQTSGPLKCWGYNSTGMAGDLIPHSMQRIMYDVDLTIGQQFMCGIGHNSYDGDVQLECWGDCTFGVCEVPDFLRKYSVEVKAGGNHVCAIRSLVEMRNMDIVKTIVGCWGSNGNGQAVVGQEGKEQVMGIAVGNGYTCTVKTNQLMTCYGDQDTKKQNGINFNRNNMGINKFNQKVSGDVNDPEYQNLVNLHKINSLANKVSVGGRNTCALMGGQTRCIGNEEFGQIDIPDSVLASSKLIKSGWDYNCAISTSQNINCWGFNWVGQTDSPIEDLSTPRQIDKSDFFLSPPVYQDKIEDHPNYGTFTDSNNRYHHTNNNPRINKQTESIPPNPNRYYFLSLSSGLSHSCAIVASYNHQFSSLICWGGQNNQNELSVPPDVGIPKDISVGDDHSCATSQGYEHTPYKILHCWGANDQGQASVPQNISKLHTVGLAAGGAHTCVKVVAQFMLNCWGSDLHGQMQPPIRILHDVEWISAGTMHTCISTLEKMEVVCWGFVWKQESVVWGRIVTQLEAGFGHNCIISKSEVQCSGDDDQGQSDVDSLSN